MSMSNELHVVWITLSVMFNGWCISLQQKPSWMWYTPWSSAEANRINWGHTQSQQMWIFKIRIEILGHIINNQGVKVDPVKTKAILDMQALNNVSEMWHFIGMTNQLSKFTPCIVLNWWNHQQNCSVLNALFNGVQARLKSLPKSRRSWPHLQSLHGTVWRKCLTVQNFDEWSSQWFWWIKFWRM